MKGVGLKIGFTVLAFLLALAFVPKEYLSGRPKYVGGGPDENSFELILPDTKRKAGDELTRLRLFEEDPFGIDPSGIFSLKKPPFRSSAPEAPPARQPLDDDVCPVRCTTTQISSAFARFRRHPVRKVVRPHDGIDCAAPYGSPVFAAGDGRVVFAGWRGAYGRLIVLRHGNGWSTWYGHLSTIDRRIRKGAAVKAGQTIGRVGTSGVSTGPHLHFETRMAGKPINPLLATLSKPAKTAKKESWPIAVR
jgi:murein DD-endopeptidase MepM/ murein hydrolase activator NlpD